MNNIYTGIGSRKTPKEVIEKFMQISKTLREDNFILRSGGAPGADQAFEWGCWSSTIEPEEMKRICEIYLPWKSFEQGRRSPVEATREEPQSEAYEIAEYFHPRWKYLKYGAKKLQARNVHQILGNDVLNPVLSNFVICWTPNGKGSGGTGQAIRIARSYNINVYDFAIEENIHELRDRFINARVSNV